jgi:capsular exopolysaccharide synthesis family protein
MSRIHEALKRAEEERIVIVDASSTAAEPVTRSAQQTPSLPPAGIFDPLPPPDLGSRTAAADLLRFEDLWDRCTKCDWNLNGTVNVFVNAAASPFIAEQFRSMRSRLYQIRDKRHLRTVLITSSLPAEGKTFIATNLAHALVRQQNCKVLLIDADLRNPELHLSLGAPLSPGLTDYLAGDAEGVTVIQRGVPEYLCFIPGGKPVQNPAELLANGRLKPLLHQVAAVFDWVVLDSPPTLPVSDAVVLADSCDGVVNVVRAAQTAFDSAQKSCQQLREKNLLGVALNCSDEFASSYYEYPTRNVG